MTYIQHLVNVTRIKALLWRTGGQIVSFLLADLTTAISNHTIIVPAWAAVIIGLLISEATKALTNWINEQNSVVY